MGVVGDVVEAWGGTGGGGGVEKVGGMTSRQTHLYVVVRLSYWQHSVCVTAKWAGWGDSMGGW